MLDIKWSGIGPPFRGLEKLLYLGASSPCVLEGQANSS